MSYITKNQRFGLWFAGDKTAGWQDFVVGVYIALVYIIYNHPHELSQSPCSDLQAIAGLFI